jgi:hypothetical protein
VKPGQNRLADLGTPGDSAASPMQNTDGLVFFSDSEDDDEEDEFQAKKELFGFVAQEEIREVERQKALVDKELQLAREELEEQRKHSEKVQRAHEEEIAALLELIANNDEKLQALESHVCQPDNSSLQRGMSSLSLRSSTRAGPSSPRPNKSLAESQGELNATKAALQDDWARLSKTLFNLVAKLSEIEPEEETGDESPILGMQERAKPAPPKLDEPPAIFSPTYLHRSSKVLLSLLDAKLEQIAFLKERNKELTRKGKQMSRALREAFGKVQELDKSIIEREAKLGRRHRMLKEFEAKIEGAKSTLGELERRYVSFASITGNNRD